MCYLNRTYHVLLTFTCQIVDKMPHLGTYSRNQMCEASLSRSSLLPFLDFGFRSRYVPRRTGKKRKIMKCKLMLSHLLVRGLFLALATTAMASNSWYVDGVNGNDNNNCKTPETACKTINHAISLSSRHDFIRIAAATYTENVGIPFALDIIGSDASTTIIDGGSGGSVFGIPSFAMVALSNVTVSHGYAQNYGGGIFIQNNGTLTINNSIISDNTVGGRGGGGGVFVAANAMLTINISTVIGNSAGHNRPGSSGGGILNNGGTVTINKSTITGNQANSFGGGICNFGTLTVNNTTVSGNGDGGIYNGGTLTVVKSTISGNTTSGGGGGITNDGRILTITNSTISGNLASDGGGLALSSGKTTISNSTIQGNPRGLGVVQGGSATITLQNSIVSDNFGGNCHGSVTSSGYNLSSDNTCNFKSTGDMNNTDPRLGALGDYGGPTQTLPLFADSPAIDAGNPNGCTDANGHLLKTDQRSFPRPGKYKHDKRCDMGAYERQTD